MTEEGEFSSTYTFYLRESREGRKEREGGREIYLKWLRKKKICLCNMESGDKQRWCNINTWKTVKGVREFFVTFFQFF